MAGKARQAGLAGEELPHGGLFDGPLLSDQRVERFEQAVDIRQRLGDGVLFGFVRWERNLKRFESILTYIRIGADSATGNQATSETTFIEAVYFEFGIKHPVISISNQKTTKHCIWQIFENKSC